MINLLPKEERKAIRNMYRMRVLVVFMCFVLALEVIAVVLFSPSFYNLYVLKNQSIQMLEQKRSGVPRDVEELQQSISRLKEVVDILKTKGEMSATSLMNEIEQEKNPGITVIAYSYDQQSRAVQIRGKSATRDDLTTFRKHMRDLGKYQSVELPPSTLLKEKDIDFTLRMSLKQ